MSEMVERVARALAAQHYCDRYKKPVNDAHVQINVDANWPDYAEAARAAIEAMREPTPVMRDAGMDAFEQEDGGPSATYTAMIDAALSTPKQKALKA